MMKKKRISWTKNITPNKKTQQHRHERKKTKIQKDEIIWILHLCGVVIFETPVCLHFFLESIFYIGIRQL